MSEPIVSNTRAVLPHGYRAYGLEIASEIPIPEFPPSTAAPDVVVRLGRFRAPSGDWRGAALRFQAEGKTVFLRHPDVGIMRVGHDEVVLDLVAGADPRVVRLFLTGSVLAVLLERRGHLILHASAVGVGDGAVAFLGGPQVGKSTLAAALHRRGHRLITDDLVVLDATSEAPAVAPGFPQLKLWPQSASSLGDDPTALPLVHPDFEKRARAVSEGFQPSPLPLRRVYVLEQDDRLGVETIAPQEAAIELVRHSYLARGLEEFGGTARNFEQCARVAGRVAVRRLRRPHDLGGLDYVAALVEAESRSAQS